MLDLIWGFLWGTIPWWFWIIPATLAAVATLIYIPGRLGGILAGAIMCLTVSTMAYSRGVQWEKAYWLAQVEAQRVALQKKVDATVAHEALAAQEADATIRQLQKERDDAMATVGGMANAGRVVIPEPLARRLRDIGQPQAPGDNP